MTLTLIPLVDSKLDQVDSNSIYIETYEEKYHGINSAISKYI